MRSTRPKEVKDGIVTVEAFYTFHKDKLSESKTKDVLAAVLKSCLEKSKGRGNTGENKGGSMMNPFKMLGDVNAMRKQAAQIQAALEQEEFEVIQGNVRILINGNQNVKVVEEDGAPNENMKRAINDAIKNPNKPPQGSLLNCPSPWDSKSFCD